MKIYEVRLVNVKSYEDAVLSFQPGINFISGINGAGKTTVIESIGYALFNYNPYGLKQLLREGAKSGEIQVLIEAIDERLYRVIRKFTAKSSTKWEVWDEESNTLLDDLHGHNDVTLWIKQNIGVDEDENLQDLFQQVIAVQQGLFTIPFLATPAERKKTFDAVLKVEAYRQAFERMQPVERFFGSEEERLQDNIEMLNRMLEELPRVEEQIKNETTALADHEKNRVELGSLLQRENAALETMHEQKKTLDLLAQSIALHEAQIEGTQRQITSLMNDLKDAEHALRITKENKQAFEKYGQLQEQLKGLEDEQRVKRELEEQVVLLDKTISTDRASLQTEKRTVEEEEIRLEKRFEELLLRKQRKEKAIAHWENILKESDSWARTAEPWSGTITAVEAWSRRQRNSIDQVVQLRQRSADLEREIEGLQEDVKDLAEWETSAKKFAAALKMDQLRKAQAQKQAERDALIRNQDYLVQGLCPIIQEACPSEKVVGGLHEFFHEQMTALNQVLGELEQEVQEQERIQSELETLRGKIQLGYSKKDSLKEKREENKRLLNQALQTIQSVDWSELDQYLKELAAVPTSFQYSVKQVLDQLEQWGLDFADVLVTQPVETIREYPMLLENSFTALTQWLTEWGRWESHLHLVVDGWDKNIKAWETWLTQMEHSFSSRLNVVQVEWKNTKEQMEEVQGQQGALNKRVERLREKTAEVTGNEKRLQMLQEKLEKYADLDQELSSIKSEMDKLLPGFKLYQENIQLAGRFDAIVQKLAQLEKHVKELKDKRQAEAEERKTIEGQYDPKDHQLLEETVHGLKKDIELTKYKIEQSRKILQELAVRHKNLMKLKAEWEDKNAELNQCRMAGELTRLLRGMLRDAADPIAHQFRQYISHLATDIYRQVSNENVKVQWAGEYEVQLVDHQGGTERERVFKQLSGGEQMTAALAIRLAMMRLFSRVGVGFFDEPTSNLDGERRQSLALAIQNATEGFEQLFVISHDDTFDSVTENVIALQKDQGAGTRVN